MQQSMFIIEKRKFNEINLESINTQHFQGLFLLFSFSIVELYRPLYKTLLRITLNKTLIPSSVRKLLGSWVLTINT
jgi:hypothetical protein